MDNLIEEFKKDMREKGNSEDILGSAGAVFIDETTINPPSRGPMTKPATSLG